MPFGAALALLAGPRVDRRLRLARLVVGCWRGCRLAMALVAGARGAGCRRASASAARGAPRLVARAAARSTLGVRRGPWLVALTFAVYAGPVAGGDRLPADDLPAGRRVRCAPPACSPRWPRRSTWSATSASGPPAACAACAPTRLLTIGFVDDGRWPPPAAFAGGRRRRPAAGAALWRGAAVLGGRRADPGHAVRAGGAAGARASRRCRTTVGWMQQWSALGQFAGPPLVAWVASRAGGWQWTWVATGALRAARAAAGAARIAAAAAPALLAGAFERQSRKPVADRRRSVDAETAAPAPGPCGRIAPCCPRSAAMNSFVVRCCRRDGWMAVRRAGAVPPAARPVAGRRAGGPGGRRRARRRGASMPPASAALPLRPAAAARCAGGAAHGCAARQPAAVCRRHQGRQAASTARSPPGRRTTSSGWSWRPSTSASRSCCRPSSSTGIGEACILGGLMAYPVNGAGGAQVVEFVRVHNRCGCRRATLDVTAKRRHARGARGGRRRTRPACWAARRWRASRTRSARRVLIEANAPVPQRHAGRGHAAAARLPPGLQPRPRQLRRSPRCAARRCRW